MSWPQLRRGVSRALACLCCLAIIGASTRVQTQPSAEHWVGTWATASVARAQGQPGQQGRGDGGRGGAGGPGGTVAFNDQTLRQIVHVSVGGRRLRVVLSNVFGRAPLRIGAAHVALRATDAAIVPASDRALTFGGVSTATIPAGATQVSDGVDLPVPALADVAIDIYVPDDLAAATLTTHAGAQQTNYVSAPGNHAGEADFPVTSMNAAWFFLARVEVTAPNGMGAVAILGDSITDGARSTPNTNHRWPDQLARRLNMPGAASPGLSGALGVLNAGIAGNRLLTDGPSMSALARFDRDILAQPGVTHVIVMEGINDIGGARDNPFPAAADLIAGHRQLIDRAHALSLKVYGVTVTPFEGSTLLAWTAEAEAKRQAFNNWIRTSHAYDAVIDFDAVLRDPDHPARVIPRYNSGDNLHPTDAGYQALGDAVDLALLGTAPSR